MISIPVRTRVEADGTLRVTLPHDYRAKEIEAFLVLQPVTSLTGNETVQDTMRREKLRALAGSITDETFVRGEQGEYETRESL